MAFALPGRRRRRPLPYRETTAAEYGAHVARTFTVTEPRPDTLILSGRCPRCAAAIDVPVVSGVFRAGGPRFGRRQRGAPDGAARSRVELMMCTCDEDHPDRPEGRYGCGAYWTVRVPAAPR
ncbi:hypothetical protein GCM10010260_45240 [Streptomyces filipinensis]|uniref:Uncharacterized protein n=1 Tax=Streptomyces filipinensis TaxID=66887 RepID=A0A918MD10_9ACTN|nr:hypothetical protein GCM10010260_45240 [Streptomyces filipinensis]